MYILTLRPLKPTPKNKEKNWNFWPSASPKKVGWGGIYTGTFQRNCMSREHARAEWKWNISFQTTPRFNTNMWFEKKVIFAEGFVYIQLSTELTKLFNCLKSTLCRQWAHIHAWPLYIYIHNALLQMMGHSQALPLSNITLLLGLQWVDSSVIGILIHRPLVRPPGGAGWETDKLSLQVNSWPNLCAC